MNRWINNKKIIWEENEIEKPCHKCGFCPYGPLVEEFPLKKIRSLNCMIFEHHCPVFYHGEKITEVR